ncbi:ABC transporter ATP-binding protein [Propylenella binzhouense]|uniref:ABC transporter ATP-binding protein n=1 Tax=Propylenella binzhouense TaxID=2555902 RepID=UPI001370F494|nr:ABC transporter ATP-binding protein [Propylenella binzhouense]
MSDTDRSLEVSGLTKVYAQGGPNPGGVRDATFSLPPGAFFTLLGPSGCGKTTTLRCIAGLETPDSGTIRLGRRTFFDIGKGVDVPLNRRRIGMVFQSYAVWPHMTVFNNVAFPLRVSKTRFGHDEIKRLVMKALASVDLASFADRSATRLSGGQQQRVALARAIVLEPTLLLLDEPLSNLDASLREAMRVELKRLQEQMGVTTIYVTHDQAEALELSDSIAVMNHGKIVQLGSPDDVYFRPQDPFIASFVGSTNLFSAKALEAISAKAVGTVMAGKWTIKCSFASAAAASGNVRISIRPEAISLHPPSLSRDEALNHFTGTVTMTRFSGKSRRCSVEAAGLTIQVEAGADAQWQEGDEVLLAFSPKDTIGFPDAESSGALTSAG